MLFKILHRDKAFFFHCQYLVSLGPVQLDIICCFRQNIFFTIWDSFI